MNTNQQDLQIISDFLAHRNCAINKDLYVDVLVIAGNSFPSIAEAAAMYYHQGITPKILICGGVGHSTTLLYENMERLDYGTYNTWIRKSEAQCLGYVLLEKGVRKEDILLEHASTNTGENASFTKRLLEASEVSISSMLLLQDPLLQIRTLATFQKVFPTIQIYSYAVFHPMIDKDGIPILDGYKDMWDQQRFLSLLMGEMHRIQDDEDGYGPCGKQFMLHVDVPKDVYEAFQRVEANYEYIHLKR